MPDLTQHLWIVWLTVVVVLVVLELITLQLVFGMIAIGCLLGGLGGTLLGFAWWGQLLSAAILSGLLVFIIRPLLWRLLIDCRPVHRTNVDALTGMTARATVAFAEGSGFAKLSNGETWTARLEEAHEQQVVQPGERLVVTAIDGATAVVAPAARTASAE